MNRDHTIPPTLKAAVALAFVVIWSACLIEAEAAPAGAAS